MGDSDSDSGSEIERVSSEKRAPPTFDKNPFDQDFRFKLFGQHCSKSGTKFQFPLKEGKILPYSTITITKKGKGKINLGLLTMI